MSHGWWHHQHRVWNILPFLTFVNVPLSRLRGSVKRVLDFDIARELKARRAARGELEQGQAKSEPSTISGS
jgi:hypothetical protein